MHALLLVCEEMRPACQVRAHHDAVTCVCPRHACGPGALCHMHGACERAGMGMPEGRNETAAPPQRPPSPPISAPRPRNIMPEPPKPEWDRYLLCVLCCVCSAVCALLCVLCCVCSAVCALLSVLQSPAAFACTPSCHTPVTGSCHTVTGSCHTRVTVPYSRAYSCHSLQRVERGVDSLTAVRLSCGRPCTCLTFCWFTECVSLCLAMWNRCSITVVASAPATLPPAPAPAPPAPAPAEEEEEKQYATVFI